MNLNAAALTYWSQVGYTATDVDELCKDLDHKYLAMRVQFNGEQPLSFTVTNQVNDSGGGHFPTMIALFNEVLEQWEGPRPQGSLVVWLEDGTWPGVERFFRRAPTLVYGKAYNDPYTFVIPDPGFWGTLAYQQELADIKEHEKNLSWEQKKPLIFWRGANSGIGIGGPDWESAPRILLARKAKLINDPERLDVAISKLADYENSEMRAALEAENLVQDYVPFKDFLNYRYQVDVDGISCAWYSCFLKLACKSTLLKVLSDQVQWYYDELKAWKHYIPIEKNLDNLEALLDWLPENQEFCKSIAEAGTEFITAFSIESEQIKLQQLIKGILKSQKPN